MLTRVSWPSSIPSNHKTLFQFQYTIIYFNNPHAMWMQIVTPVLSAFPIGKRIHIYILYNECKEANPASALPSFYKLLELPADFASPWLLTGLLKFITANDWIRATYCDNPSRPDRWCNLPDDHTARSSVYTRPGYIGIPFRHTVSLLFSFNNVRLISIPNRRLFGMI